MRKLIGVGLILASMGLFYLFSLIGLAPYMRYTVITFGIGAGIFMMVADGIISAFQGQDLAGLDQYLTEESSAESAANEVDAVSLEHGNSEQEESAAVYAGMDLGESPERKDTE